MLNIAKVMNPEQLRRSLELLKAAAKGEVVPAKELTKAHRNFLINSGKSHLMRAGAPVVAGGAAYGAMSPDESEAAVYQGGAQLGPPRMGLGKMLLGAMGKMAPVAAGAVPFAGGVLQDLVDPQEANAFDDVAAINGYRRQPQVPRQNRYPMGSGRNAQMPGGVY